MDEVQLAGSIVLAVGGILILTALILYRKKLIKLKGCLSANGTVTGLTQSKKGSQHLIQGSHYEGHGY